MEILKDQKYFEQLRNSPKKFWIFKNSTTCSISNRACSVVNETIEKANIQNIYMLDVHQQPELKLYIADFL
jgi:bacillithiol system protein YtxJ